MSAPLKFILNNQTLWLSPERCIFWEEERSLILSDLHFGKTGHFRKSGIGVPQNVFKEDLQRLFAQVQFFKPKQLLIVGDMFHSHANKEVDMFTKWRKDIPNISMQLIKGNHDILAKKYYSSADIEVTKGRLAIKDFCFTHDISLACDDDNKRYVYFFRSRSSGDQIEWYSCQEISLPCFYFTKDYAILPAFSQLYRFA